jgi:hypothetical protein
MKARILVAAGDPEPRAKLAQWLLAAGYAVELSPRARGATPQTPKNAASTPTPASRLAGRHKSRRRVPQCDTNFGIGAPKRFPVEWPRAVLLSSIRPGTALVVV